MQAVSELYGRILENPEHTTEIKVSVAGTEYSEDKIYGLCIPGALFHTDAPAIGGCVAREIDLELLAEEKIPRMAELRVYARLVVRDPLTGAVTSFSEWLPKGVFFIDTRSSDDETGLTTIHGYDAMLKAERIYLPEGDTGEWPRSMTAVAAEIARRMGVSVDGRTKIDPAYTVAYPNDYTMREVLGYIAVAHAANWVITDAGELYLCSLGDIPAETYHLVEGRGGAITFGGVRILV